APSGRKSPLRGRREGGSMYRTAARTGIRGRSARLALALLPAAATVGLFGRTAAASSSSGGHRPTITKASFGSLADGTPVDIYTLTNSRGMEVKILTYGAILQSIRVPDRHGRLANVTLGFDNLADYVAKSPYFGCITGRYANRIALGTFHLNRTTYPPPLRQPGRLRAQDPLLRLYPRPLRQPHRPRHLPSQRHDLPPADQQPAQQPPRRGRRLRQARLCPPPGAGPAQRRPRAPLHQPRRRPGLPGHPGQQGHLHPYQPQRDPHGLPGPAGRRQRPQDGHQPDQTRLLEPRR